MSISVFFNIEHYTMPQLFYYDKANSLWVLPMERDLCIKALIPFLILHIKKAL